MADYSKTFMQSDNQFVNDGLERHLAAIEPQIRAAVIAKYAEQLSGASLLRRYWLRMTIRREIRRRIDDVVSERSLY